MSKTSNKGSFIMGLTMSNMVNEDFLTDKLLKALSVLGDKRYPLKKRGFWSGMLQACFDRYETTYNISREEFTQNLITGRYNRAHIVLDDFKAKGYNWGYSKIDNHLEAMMRKANMIKGNPYYTIGKRSFWLGVSEACYEKIALQLLDQGKL